MSSKTQVTHKKSIKPRKIKGCSFYRRSGKGW